MFQVLYDILLPILINGKPPPLPFLGSRLSVGEIGLLYFRSFLRTPDSGYRTLSVRAVDRSMYLLKLTCCHFSCSPREIRFKIKCEQWTNHISLIGRAISLWLSLILRCSVCCKPHTQQFQLRCPVSRPTPPSARSSLPFFRARAPVLRFHRPGPQPK